MDILAPPRPATDATDGIRTLVDQHLVECRIAALDLRRHATAVHAVPLTEAQRTAAAEVRDMLAILAGNLTRKLNERVTP